jgi:transcriptional regulator with XRE-family HTH domain
METSQRADGRQPSTSTDAEVDSDQPARANDLGRRLRHWRELRGLSYASLAAQTETSPGYLAYLETEPGGEPSSGVLARLAAVLGTSIVELLGGDVDVLEGRGAGTRDAQLVALAPQRCWDLIGSGGIGRIVFVDSTGPIALPVNFVVEHETICCRTDRSGPIAAISAGAQVSFEADRIDEVTRTGWSVLVRGHLEQIGDATPLFAARTAVPDPWAGGTRSHWVRVRPEQVTGRVINRGL